MPGVAGWLDEGQIRTSKPYRRPRENAVTGILERAINVTTGGKMEIGIFNIIAGVVGAYFLIGTIKAIVGMYRNAKMMQAAEDSGQDTSDVQGTYATASMMLSKQFWLCLVPFIICTILFFV